MGNNSTNTLIEAGDELFKDYREVRKEGNGMILTHLESG
jgi:hypothetical protein